MVAHQTGVEHILDDEMIQKFYGKSPWIEGKVEDQASLVLADPHVVRVALMPDAHPGRMGPVGMVMDATRVFPLLIGNDIGCGMAVVRLSKPARKIKVDKAVRAWASLETEPCEAVLDTVLQEQMGTIGLGNHFCELTFVKTALPESGLARGDALVFVHTGSRGHGTRVVNALPQAKDGLVGEQAAVYMRAHDDCVAFARANRLAVAQKAAQALGCDWELICDVPHNLVERSGALWRHRKGAAVARGLTPVAGTRETPSFLVVPSGMEGALETLPHGSGRKVDRGACHARFKAPRREKDGSVRFASGRVICGDKGLLVEEMAGAYKDSSKIASAIEEEKLGQIVAQFQPQLTYKVGV